MPQVSTQQASNVDKLNCNAKTSNTTCAMKAKMHTSLN